MPKKQDKPKAEEEPRVPPKGQSIAQQVDDLDDILGDVEVDPGHGEPEKEPKMGSKEKKAAAEAAKKDDERKAILKKYPVRVGAIGAIAKGAFGTVAVFRGEHWNISDEQAAKLDSAWKPVIEIWGPEFLLKFLPVLGAFVVTVSVIGEKAKEDSEIQKAKKQAEEDRKRAKVRAEEEADHQRRLAEIQTAQRGAMANVSTASTAGPEGKA